MLGSGHLAQAGQGGHFLFSPEFAPDTQMGHTGGTTSVFKIYMSSCPGCIALFGMPGGNELE
jgi:hypothetical protein